MAQHRNSTIELLRIISMVMIVAQHYAIHGGFDWLPSDTNFSHYWYNLISIGGRAGVDIFVLITGFYLIDDKHTRIDIKRISKFWGEIFFYSIACFFIFTLAGKNDFSIKAVVESLFPILFNTWWFASTYFVLYLLHPFINKLLISVDKKTYQYGIILLTILWCFAPTFTDRDFECNDLLWFIYLYSIAGYIKLNGFNSKISSKAALITSGTFVILTYCSSIAIMLLGTKVPFYANKTTHFYDMQMLTTFIWSLSLFIFFISLKPTYNKVLNIIASCTFGVYLIHENPYIRPYLWHDLFENASQQGHVSIIIHSICCIIIVYISCTIIDLIRQMIFEKPFNRLVSYCVDRFIVPVKKAYHKTCAFIFGK